VAWHRAAACWSHNTGQTLPRRSGRMAWSSGARVQNSRHCRARHRPDPSRGASHAAIGGRVTSAAPQRRESATAPMTRSPWPRTARSTVSWWNRDRLMRLADMSVEFAQALDRLRPDTVTWRPPCRPHRMRLGLRLSLRPARTTCPRRRNAVERTRHQDGPTASGFFPGIGRADCDRHAPATSLIGCISGRCP